MKNKLEIERQINEALQRDPTSLFHISLHLSKETIKFVSSILETNTSLTSLNLRDSNLDSEKIVTLSNTLKYNTTLKNLVLADNPLNAMGAEILGKALETNTVLETLELGGTHLGDTGIKHFYDFLNNNPNLKTLKLGLNSITEVSVEEIVKNLINNTNLENLDLGQNLLNDKAAKEISNFLKYSKNLNRLDLAYNNISGLGIKDIIDASKINSALSYLNLSINIYDLESTSTFHECLMDIMANYQRTFYITLYSLYDNSLNEYQHGLNRINVLKKAEPSVQQLATLFYVKNTLDSEGNHIPGEIAYEITYALAELEFLSKFNEEKLALDLLVSGEISVADHH